jgi:hypothetical protein
MQGQLSTSKNAPDTDSRHQVFAGLLLEVRIVGRGPGPKEKWDPAEHKDVELT